MGFRTAACLLGVFACVRFGSAGDLPPAVDRVVDYEKDIAPILAAKCLDCHGEETQESRFRLDRKSALLRGGDSGEPAILLGKSEQSHLIRLVAGLEPGQVMPPSGSEPLTKNEIAILRAWIDQGANWPGPAGELGNSTEKSDHWSLQPLGKFVPPEMSNAWGQTPVDAFILKGLKERRLTPSVPADRRTFIRRLFLDTLGLPPSPEEVQRYVDDASTDATSQLIERVLASPHYGERQARYWLDLVRFAETNGFETNSERPNAWGYRDFVIKAFNDDLPYHDFIKAQISGDSIGQPVGLGFLVAGPWDQVKSPDINLTLMQRQNELDDMINTTGTVFLGLTLGCARCHNHKFDPISQTDYYALQAIFAGVQHGDMTLPLSPKQEEEQTSLRVQIAEVERSLLRMTSFRDSEQIVVIDDVDQSSGAVSHLQPLLAVGKNPVRESRGERDDPGSKDYSANVSGGTYSAWKNEPGKAVASWQPELSGSYRIWLSWGCGWDTHTKDARYLIDNDGDLSTVDDQTEIAIVNQQEFADGTQARRRIPLWSGFHQAGVFDLKPHQKIVLRSGETGTAITADVVVFEKVSDGQNPASAAVAPPLNEPVKSSANVERFPAHPSKFVRFVIEATNSGEPCIDELEVFSGGSNIALANNGGVATASGSLQGHRIHQLAHVNDGEYGNRHSWISNQKGGGWLQIEFAEISQIDQIHWARDRFGQFTDRLATRYSILSSLDGKTWKLISSSRSRPPVGNSSKQSFVQQFDHLPPQQREEAQSLLHERDRLQSRLDAISRANRVYAGKYTQPGPTHRLFRGEPLMKREEVGPNIPAVFGTLKLDQNAPEKERREALANWIASTENPLTARVIVNRIWQQHFGQGLVPTASDFGISGGTPSHPELLDWLANELIAKNWSLKSIHRVILNSATYQQSSRPNPQALEVDSTNRFLWRYPVRRLEAEAIRDTILAVSGALNLEAGGPGFSVFDIQVETVRHYFPKTSFGPAEWRRMIYMTKVRMEQDAVFGAFDCPDAATSVPQRTVSTTPLQALNLFNSYFLMQQADILSESLKQKSPEDVHQQIRLAYKLCYSRIPVDEEVRTAAEFIRKSGLPAFCRALLNSNEMLFIQ